MRNLLIALSLVTITTGCGAKPAVPVAETPPVTATTNAAVAARASVDRLLACTARLKLEALHPDSVNRVLIGLADQYDGQLLYSDLSRTAFRLPQTHFNTVLDEIEALGKLKERKITGNDVTERYKELAQRIEQLQRRRRYLIAAIAQQDDFGKQQELQSRLAEIEAEIARIDINQDSEAHEIYYALVTVSTTRQHKPGPLGWVLSNTLLGVKKLFVLN